MKQIISVAVATILLTLSVSAYAQQSFSKRLCIAFYNVENLFDTIDQENADEDFTPSGVNAWDETRYKQKLHNMSSVIAKIGTAQGPDVLGMAEVENRGVLEDLIAMPALADRGYGIVHYDSPDHRGIDCALLYKKSRMEILHSHPQPVIIPGEEDIKTRDVLYVKAKADGEILHFMVAHWPSRSGGEAASAPRRLAAAKTMKHLSDSILSTDATAKIIMMGDLNDDPVSPSMKDGLSIKYKTKDLQGTDLYTPMYDLYKAGYGTLAYRDVWSLFDMMMVSGNVVNTPEEDGYRLLFSKTQGFGAFIFNDKMLTQESGRYKGYPKRTIVGGQYQGGYADHFPVYLFLVK
ncbi:endonuclease/exonuclease/phosphatase family protein [Porphyromonas cangingivalis]|uniref:Endonuclease/Exonuclease/phosphatase family protein n=1 Tax=Porphyromonas cangingivalis TaxID=36874 RepID=A0A1T4LKH8_PORCN|nr:endonuclease/exonuclease/phosphatase family protein [Porphyromonas cangingivalis]SJZ55225.1 Endonuclease/Exonuclease/phosphatase family protein [Porphyromonas cangingivalis]VEJ02978.1 Endonuclease/Exonuclease/phosphatase family [Porphyromonas cangingivalis]